MTADGMMQMLPAEGGFPVPAHGSHVLERGGDHIMLMGLTANPEQGSMVTLSLTFEHAAPMVVELPVRIGAGDGQPEAAATE
jgi:copper(I)-binding protein